jgi:hypothetical protein
LEQRCRNLSEELREKNRGHFDFARISKDLAAAEREVGELNDIIKVKDARINALEKELKAHEGNVRRLTEMHTADAEHIGQMQYEITRLQRELGEYPPPRDTFAKSARLSFRPVLDEVKRPPTAIHPAMLDHVCFDEAACSATLSQIPEMTDQQLRETLQGTIRNKEEKERRANKVPPKGTNVAFARREREQLEDEVAELAKVVSKIKQEMKKRGIC